MIGEIDWINGSVGAILGAAATGMFAWIGRTYTNKFDFMEHRLDSVSIGSSFEKFYSRGNGENFDDCLMIRILNQFGKPLYIVRAVYYFDRARKMPVLPDAWRSQKYPDALELKFGSDNWNLETILRPGEMCSTFIPLSHSVIPASFPVGLRGMLKFEYVLGGKPGLHRASL